MPVADLSWSEDLTNPVAWEEWVRDGISLGYTRAECVEFYLLCVRPPEMLSWTLLDCLWRDGEE